MRLPLSEFVDRTDRQAPKGLLNSACALVSPMRDLLANYRGQLVADFRWRDNSEAVAGGNVFDYGVFWDHAAGHRWLFDNGNDSNSVYVDDDGVYTTDTAAYAFVPFHVDYATVPNKIDLFNANGKRVVMACAIKPVSLATPGWTAAMLMIDSTAANIDRLGWYCHYSGGVLCRRQSPYGILKTLAAGDVDKWLLFVCVKEGTTVTHRWIGGATAALNSNLAGPAYSGFTDRMYLPIGTNFRTAFAQVAVYEGNNDAGVEGTAQGDLTYTLFDAEHECAAAAVAFDTLRFSGVNDVAFEIETTPGVWRNTDGSTGAGNRVFYTNADAVTLRVPHAIGLRPVLANAGLLNADTLGKLTAVEAYYDPPRGARVAPSAPAARFVARRRGR